MFYINKERREKEIDNPERRAGFPESEHRASGLNTCQKPIREKGPKNPAQTRTIPQFCTNAKDTLF